MTKPANDGAPSASPTFVRYFVLASLCAVALIAYVQRNSIGVAEETIRRELELSKHQMGWVISSFFLAYAAFQLPTGYIGQRYGSRRALSWFVALFSAAAAVFGLAMGNATLLVTRFAMGALQAGIFPCAVNTISKWLPEMRRSFSTGMLGSFMSIGGALGAALTGLLLPLIGWRMSYLVFALPGFVFAIGFYLWFRNRPQDHTQVNEEELELIRADRVDLEPAEEEESDESDARTPWRALFTHRGVLALSGQQVCRAAGYMFFASWFATYLRETRELEGAVVGVLTSLPLWAAVIGSPTGGAMSDWLLRRTGNRRLSRSWFAAAAMLICGLLVLVSMPIANPWLAVLLISGGSFFATFGGPCAYTATIDLGGKHTPMVFSTMNMAGNFGAFLFPIVVPWLLSERELYVDKLRVTLVAEESDFEYIVEAEKDKPDDVKVVKNVGDNDEIVVRFHHSTKERRVIAIGHEVNVPTAGTYAIAIHHRAMNAPSLRLYVNGGLQSDEVPAESERNDELRWSELKLVSLQAGKNTLRLETDTEASGNWNLVLLVFAGIYFVAFVCWLFVNSDVPIGRR